VSDGEKIRLRKDYLMKVTLLNDTE